MMIRSSETIFDKISIVVARLRSGGKKIIIQIEIVGKGV